MKHLAKRLALLFSTMALVSAATLCRAEDMPDSECADGFAERVGLGLGFPTDASSERPVLVACKRWQTHPGEAIMAIAAPRGRWGADGTLSYDLQVLLVEHRAIDAAMQPMPNILARFAQSEAFAVDSVYLSQLSIDTSEWTLAPGVHAFGIRSTLNVRSGVHLYSEDSLRLYRRESASLLPVLDPLVIHRTTGAWDTRCAGSASQLRRSIGMGPPIPGRYADVVMTETVIDTSTALEQGVCSQHQIPRSHARHTLSFTGEGYPLPASWNAP